MSLQIRATTDDTLNSNLFVDDVGFQSDGTSSTMSTSDSPGVEPQAAWVTKQDMDTDEIVKHEQAAHPNAPPVDCSPISEQRLNL